MEREYIAVCLYWYRYGKSLHIHASMYSDKVLYEISYLKVIYIGSERRLISDENKQEISGNRDYTE
jgi:hypothetical protein